MKGLSDFSFDINGGLTEGKKQAIGGVQTVLDDVTYDNSKNGN